MPVIALLLLPSANIHQMGCMVNCIRGHAITEREVLWQGVAGPTLLDVAIAVPTGYSTLEAIYSLTAGILRGRVCYEIPKESCG